MKGKYDFSQIPPTWEFCFNHECARHETCLRYQTALELPASRQHGMVIYPNAVHENGCKYYRADEKVSMATGFINSKNQAMHQAFVTLRHRIETVTGSGGSYYLYRNGNRWLMPKQQEKLRQLFIKAGYPAPTFDRYQENYDFS